MADKRLLYEISIIRPLVILLLVVYHALCIYTGGWSRPVGVEPNTIYWWLGYLISGFRIETIALVGGYVFSYQCIELGKRSNFFAFTWKKFKRLIIPAIIFGIVYYMLFKFSPQTFRWTIFPWKILNGVGHLWFLPMLFWCFLLSWLIDKAIHWINLRSPKTAEWGGWGLLFLLAAFSLWQPAKLRLGLTRVPHFIFYFYLGYWLRHKMSSQEFKPASQKYILISVLLSIIYISVLCVKLQAIKVQLPGIPWPRPAFFQGWSSYLIATLKLIHTTTGMLAIYFSVWYWLHKESAPSQGQPGPILKYASGLCYGVYVYHMFFMEWLYFHTSMPATLSATTLGAWFLPWIVFLITLPLSAAATWLTLRFKFGRMLIG